MEFEQRITSDPLVMGGQPCIRHLRIPVGMILDSLADGMSQGDVLRELPVLEPDDITAALRFAASRVREEILALQPAGS